MSQPLLNAIVSEIDNVKMNWDYYPIETAFALRALLNTLKETEMYHKHCILQGKRYELIEDKLELDWKGTAEFMHKLRMFEMAKCCRHAQVSLVKSKGLHDNFIKNSPLDFSIVIKAPDKALKSIRSRKNLFVK